MRRILEFQVEFFKRKGVSANGSTAYPPGNVVIGGSETVGYIVDRSAATGEAYIPEQVYGVMDTQLSYLRAIGAVGPPAEPDAEPMPSRMPSRTPSRTPAGGRSRVHPDCENALGCGARVCFNRAYQGKEVVQHMHDQHGTLEVRGR